MNISITTETAARIKKMALAKKESYDEILNRKFDEMSDIIRGEKDDV